MRSQMRATRGIWSHCSQFWAVLQTPNHPSGEIKTRWAIGVFLEHCGYLPLILKGACRTEKRKGFNSTDSFSSVFTGVLVLCVQCGASFQINRPPNREKNAWRVLDEAFSLEIFPPVSAQDKLATNPSSFLILGPLTWAYTFHERLSWEIPGWAYQAAACPWKPPEQITKHLLTALGNGQCVCLSWKTDPDVPAPSSCLPSLSFCWERMPLQEAENECLSLVHSENSASWPHNIGFHLRKFLTPVRSRTSRTLKPLKSYVKFCVCVLLSHILTPPLKKW